MVRDGVGKRKAEPDVVAACSNDTAKKQHQGDSDRKGKDENEPPRNNVVDLTLQEEDEGAGKASDSSNTAIFSDKVSKKTNESEEDEGDEDGEDEDNDEGEGVVDKEEENEDDEGEENEDDEEDEDEDRVNVHDLYNGYAFMKESEMNVKQLKRFKAYQKQKEEDDKCSDDEEWDEDVQFKPEIIDPKASRLKRNGSSMKGYTVWTRDDNKCLGKRFDSTWTNKEDANERARYLCYWQNPWGWDPEYIDESAGRQELRGLYKYTSEPENRLPWTVAVVPDEAFETPMHW